MLSVGQKIIILKTCQKPFYKNITVVLYRKLLKKTPKISRNKTILAIAHAKAIPFAKFSVWMKN